jgi:hypothetical protein
MKNVAWELEHSVEADVFEAVSNHRTRITQRILLWGDNADAYVDQVQAGFGSTLAGGMKRVADALEKAER